MIARGRWHKPIALLTILVIVIATLLSIGAPPLLSISIAAVGAAILAGDLVLFGFLARREQRRRVRLSFEGERLCKGCNGDLWGLDVLPGKGGGYRVKCPECGVTTEFNATRIKNARRRPRRQRAQADTRSFKIR